ncbi:hypothetical protein ACKUB1_13180 [Methanospirillum stamsii]|uniref:Uncharacterized protein n=1 Tax=Methanospirillum stamsii TaxID=1277351 RepID=A0A2V2MXC4_9EURY|nr:hypothetical protein [Methanospirillum stamsii]PWR70046.1 hypothetical protein DLD82_16490 [Methanospirillum stamsii]
MTEEPVPNIPEEEKPAPAPVDEAAEYTKRITRTLIAIGAGCIAGIICYFTEQAASTAGAGNTFLFPILVMLAAIVIQKHVFMLIRIDTAKLEKKDWFYQGFMTFAFWYVSWTILLSETTITF